MLWSLCRRRVELWPWWLAHSSPKVRQVFVSILSHWLLRGSFSVGPGGSAQPCTSASARVRPLWVPECRGSRQGDTGYTPPSSARLCPAGHCRAQWSLVVASAAWTEMGAAREVCEFISPQARSLPSRLLFCTGCNNHSTYAQNNYHW